MVGTKNSGNKYSIPINPDGELGEAIESIVLPSGYGSATFIVKEFMEKHKDELIDFWNKQGKDGNATFEKWFAKWSMTKDKQKALDSQKEKDEHDKLVKQYLVLGRTQDEAEEFATACPDKDPCEVIRIRNYNTQNKPLEAKVEAEKQEKEEEANLEKLAAPTLAKLEEIKNLLDISIDKHRMMIIAKPKQPLDASMFSQVAKTIRALHGQYVSSGRNSHFEIPIEPKQQPHP